MVTTDALAPIVASFGISGIATIFFINGTLNASVWPSENMFVVIQYTNTPLLNPAVIGMRATESALRPHLVIIVCCAAPEVSGLPAPPSSTVARNVADESTGMMYVGSTAVRSCIEIGPSGQSGPPDANDGTPFAISDIAK